MGSGECGVIWYGVCMVWYGISVWYECMVWYGECYEGSMAMSRGIINGLQSRLVIGSHVSANNLWFSLYFQACKAVSIAN